MNKFRTWLAKWLNPDSKKLSHYNMSAYGRMRGFNGHLDIRIANVNGGFIIQLVESGNGLVEIRPLTTYVVPNTADVGKELAKNC